MRVLVVEDHPIMRRVVEFVLSDAGVEGEVVGSGEEAVAKVGESEFDVVFMDLGLPGIDGVEAARRIIAAPHPPAVWALSASALDEDLVRCREVGMVGTLEKPLTIEALTAAFEARTRDAAADPPAPDHDE